MYSDNSMQKEIIKHSINSFKLRQMKKVFRKRKLETLSLKKALASKVTCNINCNVTKFYFRDPPLFRRLISISLGSTTIPSILENLSARFCFIKMKKQLKLFRNTGKEGGYLVSDSSPCYEKLSITYSPHYENCEDETENANGGTEGRKNRAHQTIHERVH
jgi:hypothetical protein